MKAASIGRIPPSLAIRTASIVLIHHEGELMTVYAGMSRLSVQKGDQFRTGQKIGTSRGSGAIYIMVRKGFDAVNPESYL